jgi:hypothetical protein
MNVLRITERKIVKKIYGRKRKRTLESENKEEEDRKHITRGRYCSMCNIRSTKMVWSN